MNLDELLESSGAVLNGHFVLTSGLHSDTYIEKFRVLEQPKVLTVLCQEISERFKNDGIEVVAGPTTGGIIIAFEVARQMGLPALYVESEDGKKTLRRGATIKPRSKVLIVDDVLTTGLSVHETISAVTDRGGVVGGVAVLINRSNAEPDFGAPLFSVHQVSAKTFAVEDVPDWLQSIPVTKPGTRK